MKIGISLTDTKFQKYLDWLEYFKTDYVVLDYHNPDEGFTDLKNCDGLILTGGVDIYPELYCDWDTKETKGTYNSARDGFELRILEKAVDSSLPVLGICRGLQLINVFFRGSLIFDLNEIQNVEHNTSSFNEPLFHDITIYKDTMLYEIVNSDKFKINSYHHQAIDRLGENLMINSKSDDGIIEGIEYADKTERPFLLGVQWHPERIEDPDNPLSLNIFERFISECKFENV